MSHPPSTSLPDYATDSPLDPLSIIDQEFIAATIYAWVSLPQYPLHELAYKQLLCSFIELHDESSDDTANSTTIREVISTQFDLAYKEKTAAAVPQKSPALVQKGKQPEAVPPEKPPLDIARRQHILNKKKSIEAMENFLRPKKLPDTTASKATEPDIQLLDSDDASLDKSLFKTMRPSNKTPLTSRPVTKTYGKKANNTDKNKKRLEAADSPPTTPQPRKRAKSDQPTVLAPDTLLDALKALITVAETTAAHVQETADNTAAIKMILTKGDGKKK